MNNNTHKKIYHTLIYFIIIFSTLLIVGSLLVIKVNNEDILLKTNIERNKRNEARMALKDVTTRFQQDIKNGRVDPNDIKSVSKWAEQNFAGLRNGTKTSDGFIIELSSEMFVYDGSPDCSKNIDIDKGRYMKDEAVMHKDPKKAEIALNQMRLGINTIAGDNFYWNFDGKPEWLEWLNVPEEPLLGIDDQPRTIRGIKNPNFKKYLFVLGTQSDEAFEPYKGVFDRMQDITNYIYILLGLSFFLIIFSLFRLVYIEFHKCPARE